MGDELNKAKLRVFLDAKRLGKMSVFFKFWADVMRNSGLYKLQELLDEEDRMIAALQAKVDAAEAQLGGNNAAAGSLRGQLNALNSECAQMESQASDLESRLRCLTRKIQETEDLIADEQQARKPMLMKIKELERELDATYAVRDRLAAELQGIAGEV